MGAVIARRYRTTCDSPLGKPQTIVVQFLTSLKANNNYRVYTLQLFSTDETCSSLQEDIMLFVYSCIQDSPGYCLKTHKRLNRPLLNQTKQGRIPTLKVTKTNKTKKKQKTKNSAAASWVFKRDVRMKLTYFQKAGCQLCLRFFFFFFGYSLPVYTCSDCRSR